MMLQKVILLFLLVTVSLGYERQYMGTLRRDTIPRRARDVFENLFNLYDPSFLSTVWPKISNGIHLQLELSCWDDMTVFFRDLADGRAWAYDAVDASGRYQSALFTGNRFWLGSREECRRLDTNSIEKVDKDTIALLRNHDYLSTVFRRQKYFDAEINDWRYVDQQDEIMQQLAAADHTPPFRMSYNVLQINLNVTKLTMIKSYDITLGVCFPESCPHDDVESVINFSIMLNDNLKSNRTVPRITKIVSSRKLDEDFLMGSDIGAIVLIVITTLLASVAVLATLVDFDLMKCVRYKKQSMSFDLPTSVNTSETKLVDELKRKHKEIRSVDDILAETANINLAQLDKKPRSITSPPINLDVLHADRSGSCIRCGKYKKQCPNRHVENVSTTCPRVKYSSFASISTDRRKNNFFCRLLLCFSLRHSWMRIFNKNTANKDLALIHIIRIVATLWVIFIHVAVIAGNTSDDSGDINDRDNLYYILSTGTIAFDTLFFVSGLFSAHHFFYLKSRYSVEELVSFSGTCGHFMQFVCFVTNRVIRLLPSYMYAILVSSVVARAARSVATLTASDGDHLTCDQYWWRNLLYVTTLYPQEEQCMQISWYLSTETQLHAAGAVACAASMSASARARLVAVLAGTLALAAAAADIGSAYYDDGMRYLDVNAAYWWMLVRPCARAAPYFAGVLAGWLAHSLHGRIKLTKMTRWMVMAATAPLVCASCWLPLAAQWWLSSWLHVAWPSALLVAAILSTALHATSFRGMLCSACAALSRLSYSMLLLHGVAARLLLLPGAALCSHTICIWMYFSGTALVTVAGALLLSLLIEMPACSLFRSLSDCATA